MRWLKKLFGKEDKPARAGRSVGEALEESGQLLARVRSKELGIPEQRKWVLFKQDAEQTAQLSVKIGILYEAIKGELEKIKIAPELDKKRDEKNSPETIAKLRNMELILKGKEKQLGDALANFRRSQK